jgi:hypothetical protein
MTTGGVFEMLSDNRTDDVCLWAWPDLWNGAPGVMAFVRFGPDGKTMEHRAAWPATYAGSRHELHIRAIHEDPKSGSINMVRCGAGDAGVGLTAFDTFCHVAGHALLPDMRVSAHVHGWALKLEPASRRPLTLQAHEVNESVREAMRDAFERDGQITIDTGFMTTIMERGDASAPSPLHDVQGLVVSVREAAPILGRTLRTLGVAVVMDGDDILLDIEITVTDAVWQGEWPKVGDRVRGVVWLQASFDEPGDDAWDRSLDETQNLIDEMGADEFLKRFQEAADRLQSRDET